MSYELFLQGCFAVPCYGQWTIDHGPLSPHFVRFLPYTIQTAKVVLL